MISKAKRMSLPKSEFGLPSERKYPIDTAKRAHSALSYGARYATPSEYKQIETRVHRRYPDIKIKRLKA